jgi:DNA-binding IscR family transcriptional regulator
VTTVRSLTKAAANPSVRSDYHWRRRAIGWGSQSHRGCILKGIRGPHGGYELARERHGVTANDILRAASTVHEAGEEPNSELVAKLVLPVLSAAEQEFGQALSRISLDDMVHRAASIATERVATKAA